MTLLNISLIELINLDGNTNEKIEKIQIFSSELTYQSHIC